MKLDWKTCLRAGVTIVATYLTIQYWNILTAVLLRALQAAMPLVAGCVIAYIVNILMGFFERVSHPLHRFSSFSLLKKPLCLLLSYVTVICALTALISIVLPELRAAVVLVVEKLPGAVSTVLTWLDETLHLSEVLDLPSVDWQTTLRRTLSLVSEYVGSIMNATILVMSSVVSVVITIFISIVFSIYLLSGRDRLRGQVHRLMRVYIGQKRTEKLEHILATVNRCFHNYISGQCIEAVILGLLCMLGMLIFRFPYAGMVSTLIGFTALIPIAGAYIGAIVGAFVILTVSSLKALLFLLFIIALQQFEGNVIFPRVVGSSIGLPGVWVLAAVTIGSGLFGIPGLLLGVPLAASAYQLLREDLARRDPSADISPGKPQKSP